MNAQEKMIEYAKSKMGNSRLTPEQWCGKMITEGIVINRDCGDILSAKATRNGKVITITEITKKETLAGWETSSIDVMQIDL